MAEIIVDDSTIEQKVLEEIKFIGGLDELPKPETNLFHDLQFDSLDIVECVMEIEQEFNVVIEDEICNALETVGDFIEMVKEAVKGRDVWTC